MIPLLDDDGKRLMFYAHRLAYALHYGRSPTSPLDHRNGIRIDNRIVNIREATSLENAGNITSVGENKRGVTQHSSGKWISQISRRNKNIYLGSYATEAEAHAAFTGAATALRSEFANLTNRKRVQ